MYATGNPRVPTRERPEALGFRLSSLRQGGALTPPEPRMGLPVITQLRFVVLRPDLVTTSGTLL